MTAKSLLAAAAAAALLLIVPCASFAPQTTHAPRSTATGSLKLFGRSGSAAPLSPKSPSADAAVSIFTNRFAAKRKARPIIEADLRANFAEMSKLFGDVRSLEMVEILPQLLEMERSHFTPSYEIYCRKFGNDETDALLLRNPVLLGLKPDGYGGAEEAEGDTIALSYVIAATRPLGKYGLLGIVGLLSVPALEQVTGLSRATLLSQLPGF